MSSSEIVIAFLPLAVYLGLIGTIPFFRRPVVRSGGLDLFYLWLGLGGLVMIGPAKLLFPVGSLMIWKEFAFLLIGALYILVAIFVTGTRMPRIVVYNIREEDFQAILDNMTQKSKIQRVGPCVLIPDLGVQFSYEIQPFWRCLVIQTTGIHQNLQGWTQWERELREQLSPCKTPLTGKALFLPAITAFLLIWSGCCGRSFFS